MKLVKVQRRKSDIVVGVPKELQHLTGNSKYMEVKEENGELRYIKIERK